MPSLELKNIILVAGTGKVGKAIVDALEHTPHDFTITITTRHTSSPPSWLPASIKTIPVDYESNSDLVNVLKGQDAVVSCFQFGQIPLQKSLLDAAIENGVKFFIPSDFGVDTSETNPFVKNLGDLKIFNAKLAFDRYLTQKAEEGKIHWSTVYTSLFFDTALKSRLLGFDISTHTATIVDGGDKVITTTTAPRVGEAAVQLLLHPETFLNRGASVATVFTTQNETLKELESATGKEWKKVQVTSAELIKKGLSLSESNIFAGYPSILTGVFVGKEGDKYYTALTSKDAEKLGLKPTPVGEIVRGVL